MIGACVPVSRHRPYVNSDLHVAIPDLDKSTDTAGHVFDGPGRMARGRHGWNRVLKARRLFSVEHSHLKSHALFFSNVHHLPHPSPAMLNVVLTVLLAVVAVLDAFKHGA